MDAAQFIDALGRVAGGGTALDPAVIAKLLGGPARAANDPLKSLTERERSVLELMAEDCPTPRSRPGCSSTRARSASTRRRSSPSSAWPNMRTPIAASAPCWLTSMQKQAEAAPNNTLVRFRMPSPNPLSEGFQPVPSAWQQPARRPCSRVTYRPFGAGWVTAGRRVRLWTIRTGPRAWWRRRPGDAGPLLQRPGDERRGQARLAGGDQVGLVRCGQHDFPWLEPEHGGRAQVRLHGRLRPSTRPRRGSGPRAARSPWPCRAAGRCSRSTRAPRCSPASAR